MRRPRFHRGRRRGHEHRRRWLDDQHHGDDDGDERDRSVCESGACGIDTVMMGNIELGVCSECDADEDCADGLTCQAPNVGMGGIEPGACG